MTDTFLGNTCVSGWVYHYLKLEYNNPFIWHLILDDEDFIKVCENFEHYMNQEPIFVTEDNKDGRYLSHPSISKTYPILRLDDVNFHFIHHKSEQLVLDNFNKRKDRVRGSRLIPVAWDNEIKNPEQLKRFSGLPNSILATGVKSQEDGAKQIIKLYGK